MAAFLIESFEKHATGAKQAAEKGRFSNRKARKAFLGG
jgi:hypothetical protein